MSNNTDTPAFLIIHPILTSSITQYFHPLPFIGQYFSTPLSNPPSSLFPLHPYTSLLFHRAAHVRTQKSRTGAPSQSAISNPPSGDDFLKQKDGIFAPVAHGDRDSHAAQTLLTHHPRLRDPPSVSRTTTTPRLPPRRPERHCSRAGPPTFNVDTEWSGSACPRTSLRGCKVWV